MTGRPVMPLDGRIQLAALGVGARYADQHSAGRREARAKRVQDFLVRVRGIVSSPKGAVIQVN